MHLQWLGIQGGKQPYIGLRACSIGRVCTRMFPFLLGGVWYAKFVNMTMLQILGCYNLYRFQQKYGGVSLWILLKVYQDPWLKMLYLY